MSDSEELTILKKRFKVSQRTLKLLADRYRFLRGVIEETIAKAAREIESECATISDDNTQPQDAAETEQSKV